MMMLRSIGILLMVSSLRVCGNAPAPSATNAVTPSTEAVVAPARALPAARHGGSVQRVGNYAVETVAARTGGVALFWMDLDGRPVPTDQVTMESVRVDVNGREREVPVRVVNGAFVAQITVPASATVAVTIPEVVLYGLHLNTVVVSNVVVVAALPGIIVIPTAPVIMVGKHRKFRHFRGGFVIR